MILDLLDFILLFEIEMQNITNLFKRPMDSTSKVIVADELVPLFPQTNEKLKSIIQKIPLTSKVLFHYKKGDGMSKDWKWWALEMMEKGMETPGIVQLAGEDLNLNFLEFSSLVLNIFKELEIDLVDDDVYYQYAIYIAHQVVNGELASEKGLEILTEAAFNTDYHDAFMSFYHLEDDAELLRDGFSVYKGDGYMQKSNIGEWMYQYFEKLIKFNE